jgi:aspartate-semialdehyde dehydrogenase
MPKLPVAVVGATGIAGQQFLAALADHALFEVKKLAASERSAGKRYREAIRDSAGATKWFCSDPPSPAHADLLVEDAAKLDVRGLSAVFSAVEAEPARELEPKYAKEVPVISTASAFRYEKDVPILIPPVNATHAGLFAAQRKARGWKGFITPIPNCTTTGLAITLAPLDRAFGVEAVWMTSMQACSGAGRSPGVIALDIIDNVVPFIAKEEEKVEIETKKILGTAEGTEIRPHAMSVSCTCTRVPVLEGHTESVFVRLRRKADIEEVKSAMREWKGDEAARKLPSSPPHWIHVSDDPYRPQPRLDRDAGKGMVTSVGRLREDKALGNGVKYVLVSHNTKMGAAAGAILVGELLHASGAM